MPSSCVPTSIHTELRCNLFWPLVTPLVLLVHIVGQCRLGNKESIPGLMIDTPLNHAHPEHVFNGIGSFTSAVSSTCHWGFLVDLPRLASFNNSRIFLLSAARHHLQSKKESRIRSALAGTVEHEVKV